MSYERTTDNVDLTNDYIAADSTETGSLKKLDTEIDNIYTILNLIASNHHGSSEPTSPEAGYTWDDSGAGTYKKYSGSAWESVASAAGISNVSEDTTPELGGNLDLNQKSIILDPTPTSDHTYNGIIETQTAGENLVVGDVCYLKAADGKFWLADADAEATTGTVMLRMATTTIAADATGVFLVQGYIRDDTWAWTVGAPLFINTTGGNPTETAPSGTGDIKRIVGYAQSADIVYFNPDSSYVEIP